MCIGGHPCATCARLLNFVWRGADFVRSRVNFVRDFFVAVLIALTPNRPRIIHPLPDHSQHLIAYRTNMIAIKLHTSDCNQPSHHPNHFFMIAIKLPPSPPTPPSFSYIDCNHNINTLFMQRRPLAIFTLLSSADTTPQTIDLVPKHLRSPLRPFFLPGLPTAHCPKPSPQLH